MPSYYKEIDGVKLDRAIIDECMLSVKGQGDGRVSVDDAKNVFKKVADGGEETQHERWTVRYCLTEFNWTEAAKNWITQACKGYVKEDTPIADKEVGKKSFYEVIDGVSCDRGIIDACRKAVAGQGDGRVSKDDAVAVFAEAADGGKVTHGEMWTLRLCLTEFHFTEAAHDWIVDQMKQAAAKKGIMKRPAAAGGGASKKPKVDTPASKCAEVAEALKIAEKKGLSEELTTLLGSMVEHTLSKEHVFQTEVADMVSKVLATAEEALKDDVAGAEATVTGGDETRKQRVAAVEECAATLTSCQEDCKAKATAKTDAVAVAKEAVAKLKEMEHAQKEGDADVVVTEKNQATLANAAIEIQKAKDAPVGKRGLNEIVKLLEPAGLEDTLIACLQYPLMKTQDKRGNFDAVVLAQLDEELKKAQAGIAASLAEAAPAKEARAAAVAEATAANEAAKTASTEAATALQAAKDAEAAAKDALAAAKASETGLDSELKKAAKAFEEAQEALSAFRNGAKAAWMDLQKPPSAE